MVYGEREFLKKSCYVERRYFYKERGGGGGGGGGGGLVKSTLLSVPIYYTSLFFISRNVSKIFFLINKRDCIRKSLKRRLRSDKKKGKPSPQKHKTSQAIQKAVLLIYNLPNQ